MQEIDDNMEEIKKEQAEYYNVDANKSSISKVRDADNAYLCSREDRLNMERINDSLY